MSRCFVELETVDSDENCWQGANVHPKHARTVRRTFRVCSFRLQQ